jgi:hypothetical protein
MNEDHLRNETRLIPTGVGQTLKPSRPFSRFCLILLNVQEAFARELFTYRTRENRSEFLCQVLSLKAVTVLF